MSSSPTSLYVQHYPADAGTGTGQSSPTAPKPILILIHGGALSHRMYKDTIPHLTSRGYSVYAPDLPGHGDSAHLGPFTFARTTHLLETLIKNIQGTTSSTTLPTTSHDDLQPFTSAGPKKTPQLVLVGVSLGGQVVLSALQHFSLSSSTSIAAAVVSGVSIHAPSAAATWEMPRLPPPDSPWTELMMADVAKIGTENAGAVQQESLAFEFHAEGRQLPPVCVLVGEEDVAMAKRDFEEVVRLVGGLINERGKGKSRGLVVPDAWHNHPIDIPDRFAEIVDAFVRDVL